MARERVNTDWNGSRAVEARQWCIKHLGRICWLCGHYIEDLNDYTVDHELERSTHPELTWVKSNWRPAHGKKHRELNCPGNFGRSARRATTRKASWTADGW